jgi:hypothetical protein
VLPEQILACIHWPDASILDFYYDWLLLERVGLPIANRKSAGVWLGTEYLIHSARKPSPNSGRERPKPNRYAG